MRVIRTSLAAAGSMPSELSIVSDTSARPSAGLRSVPAKITSSIRAERTALGAWAPRTQATASTTFDLPLPLGPTTTVTPGSRRMVASSAKDLKPFRVSVFRYTAATLVGALADTGHPPGAASRLPRDGLTTGSDRADSSRGQTWVSQ